MLYFDHCFTADPRHKFHKALQKRGFVLEPQEVEHPGKAFCRFIMLKGKGPRSVQYLEFVYVKPGGRSRPGPGLSFGYTKNLEGFANRLKKRMPGKVRFFHKNYAWKTDAKSRLPGWNFVDFKNLKIGKFFPFITEYEPHPDRPKKRRGPRHPNGARTLVALELEVTPEGRRFFETLAGPKLRLACGTRLILRDARKFRFAGVVLKSGSLKKFRAQNPDLASRKWEGKSAVTIPNPAGMWDIVVI